MRGLYVITDSRLQEPEELLSRVDAALFGGATVVQYRDKTSTQAVCEQQALALKTLCRERGALLIINDDIRLAQRINADGVHLGREDSSLSKARSHLGPGKIIGISCYSDVEAAQQAERDGANYVAFGRFFPSHSKPDAPAATLKVLKKAHKKLHCPIVAIGGITAENGAPLVQTGADMLAVIHGVFGQDDITRAASQITALYK